MNLELFSWPVILKLKYADFLIFIVLIILLCIYRVFISRSQVRLPPSLLLVDRYK